MNPPVFLDFKQCTVIDPTKDPEDPDYCVTWEEVCSIESVTLERISGKGHKQRFENVSKELLTLCVEVCVEWDLVTGDCLATEWMRLYLFDETLRGYFWEYDNNKLKLLQVRFYPWGTDVSEGDGDLDC